MESQIVTEYRYDCDNDLEMAWDANHPSELECSDAGLPLRLCLTG